MKKIACIVTFLLVSLSLAGWARGQATKGKSPSRAGTPQARQVGDWPQFRGPGGLGTSDAKGLPLTWGPDQNIVWQQELPGHGSSSPIVVGERVFVTGYSGFGARGQAAGEMQRLQRQVLCYSLTNGKLLWQKTLPANLPESPTVREHGYAASTPASDGERLYVFFGKSGVFAFDLDGRQLWQTDVGSQVHGWGSAASPVVYQDLVIINACIESESLIALNRRTGKEVWRMPGIKESWSMPQLVAVAGGKTELVVAVLGKLLGVDPASGQSLWSAATDIAWYMVPSLVARDGIVYCIGGRSGGGLAVRAGGRGDVTQSHRLWTGKKGSNVSSPVLYDGHLYWAHDTLGIAYCAEVNTGKIVYEERLARAGQIYASPVLADGKLYYVSRHSGTYVLAAKPRFEQLAHNDLADESIFDASPAVAGNRLLLRSDRSLYCIGQK